jgi:hypothetical protein
VVWSTGEFKLLDITLKLFNITSLDYIFQRESGSISHVVAFTYRLSLPLKF